MDPISELDLSDAMDRNDALPDLCQERGRAERNSNSEVGCGANVASISAVCPSSERGAVSSRCSVKLIHEIISKFSDQKIRLVQSIGFEGILHIPLLKQINLKFSAWLMSRVDELSHTLLIADGSRLKFCKEDVGSVFGIPSSGISIFSSIGNVQACAPEFSGRSVHSDAKQFRSIKAAQAIVSRQHDLPMSSMEEDEFRAAFVVFVMSALLAPCAKHDRVSDDYLHAIQNPSQIGSYDWAEYVLRRLLDAVAKLKADIANNVKTPYIYGCSLFLQVLYLDSLDLGVLSMAHDQLPRIRCFTSDRLRSMIAADFSFTLNGHDMFAARRIKLRKCEGVCYHWARSQSAVNRTVVEECPMLELWEFSVTMTRVLKIPPEAAGPLFIAASDFQKQFKGVVGADALKFMDVLLHLMEPYLNGFSYKPSISLNSRPIDLCYTGHHAPCKDAQCCLHFSSLAAKRKATMYSGECSSLGQTGGIVTKRHRGVEVGPSSHVGSDSCLSIGSGGPPRNIPDVASLLDNRSEDVDMRVINTMARFYLSMTPVKTTRCSDLNSVPPGDDFGFALPSSGGGQVLQAPRSPWELGYSCNIDLAKASYAMRKLKLVEDIDEPWIAHYGPKYIEVITRAIKDQFVGQSEFEMQLVDAAIRRFRQIDDEIYADQGRARWRHFVESDFMVSLLAGMFDMSDPVLRSHFLGPHINYDVTACRVIFFPLILHYRWICFAWRMDNNTIVVYDPFIPRNAHSEYALSYERVVKLLKTAMVMVSSSIVGGWLRHWQDATVEIFNHGNSRPPSYNRTGLMCLHFCRCFDGANISPPLDVAHIQDWSATILGEVSSLVGNLGVARNLLR